MTVLIKRDETYSYPFPYKRLSVRITAFLRFTVICFWIVLQMEVIGISKYPVSHQNFSFSFQIPMLMNGMSPVGTQWRHKELEPPLLRTKWMCILHKQKWSFETPSEPFPVQTKAAALLRSRTAVRLKISCNFFWFCAVFQPNCLPLANKLLYI